MYESLLLNCGGGITNTRQQSEQYKGAAALAIGIGGTGVAALAALKRKVYQQLLPDDPDSLTPAYRHVQFLAIDSDDRDIEHGRGTARLDEKTEFLSIMEGSLIKALHSKDTIKNDPCLSWMQIDRLCNVIMPDGVAGERQVGRYLLIKNADNLYMRLWEKFQTLQYGPGKKHLDVYIFAGLSGGTGSGCFLDTCYIVRHVLAEMHLDARSRLMGFFILPRVSDSEYDRKYRSRYDLNYNSNGYAALKELDYLMDLKHAADRFRQNYGPFQVDTDKPPVDLCCLISAARADGTALPNSYDYCISVASDFVMSCLADDSMGGAGDHGPTMRAHLDNAAHGVRRLPSEYGANRSYLVLGVSYAELPMTQIATYLAAGFNRRFQAHAKDAARTTLTRSDVTAWAEKLKLTEEQITHELGHGTQMLSLPDIDYGTLRAMGPMSRGRLPTPWATPGNAWLAANAGEHTRNRTAQNGKLSSWKADEAPTDPIVGRVFKKLCELCMDPNYGPYYAANLLHHEGYDLISCLTGAIRAAEEKRRAQEVQLTDRLDRLVVRTSTDFCTSGPFNRRHRYVEYKSVVTQWYLYTDRVDLYDQAVKALTQARDDLQALYTGFFAPLIRMLDALNETFEEDFRFLNRPAAMEDTGYTWRILELDDVKPRLDAAVAALTDRQLVGNLLRVLLEDPDAWLSGDEGKISRYISRHMETVFSAEINRSLQDHLFERFPAAGGDISRLAQEVEDNIISRLDRDAEAMFWCDPQYDLSANSFRSGMLSVPGSATAICTAASEFKKDHGEYTVRETGLQDRIFALKLFSGVPLYAYQGMRDLRDNYEATINGPLDTWGFCAHLFADTGRAPCDVPEMNWRDFLPAPVPYSFDPAQAPKGKAAMELYDQAVQEGVICKDWARSPVSGNYYKAYFIHRSGDIDVPAYTRASFLKDGELQTAELLKAKQDLQKKLDGLYADSTRPDWIRMLDDGQAALGEAVVERVRRDHFVRFPRLQQIVQQELDKKHRLENAIQTLDAILVDEAGKKA